MSNLKEFLKVEEHTRVVSAWKYLPKWKRKLLRAKFQIEVWRVTLPIFLARFLTIAVAFVFFMVTPFPVGRKTPAPWVRKSQAVTVLSGWLYTH